MNEKSAPDESGSPNEDRSSLIEQVLLSHLQRRTEGEEIVDDEVLAKHPELLPELAERLQLLREIADRRQHRPEACETRAVDNVTVGTSQDQTLDRVGLQIRCPHCKNAIELVEEESLSDVACSSCGSSVNLVTDSVRNLRRVGHFDLIERVGSGAFGVVWKAYDTMLDRNVAVKIPRKGQLTAEAADQFLREARMAAQLKHANIVRVYEVGRQNDTV